MIYAYCVRRAGDPGPAPALTGVDGARVELLEEAELGLWTSPGAGGRPTVERLRQHDGVVRAALRSATPLPIRYGAAIFADAAAARNALRDRRDEYRSALERVAGRVEVGVRVGWTEGVAGPEPESGPVRSGREYLEVRRRRLEAEQERLRSAEAALDRVAEAFAPLELPTVRRTLPQRDVAGTLAHLVQTNRLAQYREHAAGVRDALKELDLSFSGPWAPYSFV